MISVQEADRRLADFAVAFAESATESVALDAAAGRVLREPVLADREYPAQDRSRMDGVAIAYEAFANGARVFPVKGLARAGDPRIALSDREACVEIMTGAACPEGADTILPYESIVLENGAARFAIEAAPRAGQFLHRRGSDCARGDVLVAPGVRLHAAALAAAASMGYARLRVSRLPRVAVVATGDELVSIEATPLPHQVRASNAPALAALLAGFAEVSLYEAGDAPEALTATLAEALQANDALLVTGGVSAGKFDGIPDALAALGVENIFHKIAQKPGKPLWFGRKGSKPVFGLPGNPVSALVCARRYAVPLLRALQGLDAPPRAARLEGDLRLEASSLARFAPVRRSFAGAETRVAAHEVNGSGDFSRLAGSDGFIEIPAGVREIPHGESLPFYGWDD